MNRTHRSLAVRTAATVAVAGVLIATAGCSSQDDSVSADGKITLVYQSWLPTPGQCPPAMHSAQVRIARLIFEFPRLSRWPSTGITATPNGGTSSNRMNSKRTRPAISGYAASTALM